MRRAADRTNLLDVIRAQEGEEVLERLAGELRRQVIDAVARRGGHLGPNLGVVELSIALHREFNSPRDVILWDTGHQSYVHKLLTGRTLDSLRSFGGISGYPSRSESIHDWVENSHAGTSLSYAAGLVDGRARAGGTSGRVVAVIGDGALTAGMAMEAMNDILDRGLPVIVVINDNGRSYQPTTGAVAKQLARCRTGERPSTSGLLSCPYIGPVDGHSFLELAKALAEAHVHRGPVIVHVVTQKGRGYPPAETDEADCLHGVGPFELSTGEQHALPAGRTAASIVVGETLLRLARADPRVMVVTAAMGGASGLDQLAAELPQQFFDVGIAEQHATTFAAGLAMAGMRPVVVIHSTFLNRAFDQIMFDVGLHRLPVVFVADRSGITGADGPSHHGLVDVALFRHVPGALISAPSTAPELAGSIALALQQDGPVLVRHAKAVDAAPRARSTPYGVGRWVWHGEAGDALLIASGELVMVVDEAAARLREHGWRVTVANALWISPLDSSLTERARQHRVIVTVEDHYDAGGLGTAVLELLSDDGVKVPIVRCGVPVGYLPHGEIGVLRRRIALDAEAIVAQAEAALHRSAAPTGR